MELSNSKGNVRILARSLARELTAAELELVSGGDTSGCSKSTCSGSDNNSCDLDNCHDNTVSPTPV